jgi:TM2 domain-containing membrane protein YozV
MLGIHNFYLGYNGRGIAQLLISILSCFWLAPVVWIWALIEGILIFTGSIATDAGGFPLRD